jgi:hypothetical protein
LEKYQVGFSKVKVERLVTGPPEQPHRWEQEERDLGRRALRNRDRDRVAMLSERRFLPFSDSEKLHSSPHKIQFHYDDASPEQRKVVETHFVGGGVNWRDQPLSHKVPTSVLIAQDKENPVHHKLRHEPRPGWSPRPVHAARTKARGEWNPTPYPGWHVRGQVQQGFEVRGQHRHGPLVACTSPHRLHPRSV